MIAVWIVIESRKGRRWCLFLYLSINSSTLRRDNIATKVNWLNWIAKILQVIYILSEFLRFNGLKWPEGKIPHVSGVRCDLSMALRRCLSLSRGNGASAISLAAPSPNYDRDRSPESGLVRCYKCFGRHAVQHDGNFVDNWNGWRLNGKS